jgi:hypothetical protein
MGRRACSGDPGAKIVMPARTRVSMAGKRNRLKRWIPACAGMTISADVAVGWIVSCIGRGPT